MAFGPLFRVPLLRFGHEIRWCFAVAHVVQSHAFCDWRAGWLQDVANLRNKLKSLSFSRVSEVALRNVHFGLGSSFRAIVFCCREARQQPEQRLWQ